MTRLQHMQALRRDGMRLWEIGKLYGVSGNWVGKILRGLAVGDPIEGIKRDIARPAWTIPDADLIAECHAARDEIRQSWR